jgi:hypothetical protein
MAKRKNRTEVVIHSRLIDEPRSYSELDLKAEKLLYILFDGLDHIKNKAFRVAKEQGIPEDKIREHYPEMLRDETYRTVKATRKDLLDAMGKSYQQKNIDNLLKQIISLLRVVYRSVGFMQSERETEARLAVDQMLLIRRLVIDGFVFDPARQLDKNKGGDPFQKSIEITFDYEMVLHFYTNFQRLDGSVLRQIGSGPGVRAFATITRARDKIKALSQNKWTLPDGLEKRAVKKIPEMLKKTGLDAELSIANNTIYRKGSEPTKSDAMKARDDRRSFEKIKRDMAKHKSAVMKAQSRQDPEPVQDEIKPKMTLKKYLETAPAEDVALFEKRASGQKLSRQEMKEVKRVLKALIN